MKHSPLVFLLSCLLFITSTVIAQEPDSTSAIFKMREAERNFARESIMFGRNAAFVKNFADVSVIFTDKWLTNGKQFWKNRKNAPVILKWEPEYMDIAESGDFGISTGPWEAQEYRPNTPVQSTGYFLTVWKKEATGTWKVILDAGSETPVKAKPDHVVDFPGGADKSVAKPIVVSVEKSVREILDTEKSFLMEWKKNPDVPVYLGFLEPMARMQLNGHLPATSRDSISVFIRQRDKNLNWNSMGAGAASSGDMGFTYGMLEKQGNPTTIKGHYVRIWKKHPGTKWKIALEMISLN
jgi:ketosteroid isomerase-like protein